MAVIISKQIVAPSLGPTFVDYLESTGTQHIDTDFKPNQNSRIEVTFESSDSASGVAAVDGGWLTRGFGVFTQVVEFGDTQYNYGVTSVKKTVVLDKGAISIDGTVVKTLSATFQSTVSLVLFALNRSGTIQEHMVGKIYSCRIYDNGILVRDYRPCYDPDGVACMYEEVSGTYSYNAGSGSFAAGGAV
jgi:hypothetical protein